ncbi:pineapple eye protein-like [Oppia nitens]|uniref:pineapple eye protein-like n=1 Tax=Oppia nitens TaxID=1686743 RepID=UPI0023DC20E2|nr:pineapple eye protein-like [Oppia nitens]
MSSSKGKRKSGSINGSGGGGGSSSSSGSANGDHHHHQNHRRKMVDKECLFCFKSNRNSLRFGKMIKLDDIYVHYYCLLLASGLSQNGKDSEGIYGFLVKDIHKEQRRGDKLSCNYCRKKGATIGCSVASCKVSFHLPCGIENKTMSQFFDNFHSYCLKHRPKQELPKDEKTKSVIKAQDLCPICYSDLTFDEGVDVLATPCCLKLVHRSCIQKQALSAGYFFKCPLCNCIQEFKDTMIYFGIFIPRQDASWERDNNAFGELYQRHATCDQSPCQCPSGRKYNSGPNWHLLICDTCGSRGAHWSCIDEYTNTSTGIWNCDDCRLINQRIEQRADGGGCPTGASTTAAAASSTTGSNDDESDIEVISSTTTADDGNEGRRRLRRKQPKHFLRKTSVELVTTTTTTSTGGNSSRNQSSIEITVDLSAADETPLPSKRQRRGGEPKTDKTSTTTTTTMKTTTTTSPNQQNTTETKDISIQCDLVSIDDLIDCDPIDELEEYVIKRSMICLKTMTDDKLNDKEEEEDDDNDIVVDIDESSDEDDCILLN